MPDSSPKVQILDDTTANQIAAGEVVERPAAAAKELVENALDAGAHRILVELEDGGKRLLRVTDDGSGMGQADAVLSLQRHATSKIVSSDDLFRITTMGFRGEALPSIASVSQMTLTTKEAGEDDAPGTQILVSGGTLDSVSEIGARSGTSVCVENLFWNVPARLKFLKSASTELSHIVETVQRLALARPDVAFRVTQGAGDVFTTSGNGSLLDACVSVLGRDTARHLLPLSWEGGGLGVSGFLSAPAGLKTSRSGQFTFVNHRFVRNRAVTRAIDEAYKSVQTLHGQKFPAAIVFVDIDPSQVDVNVSPTKTEVRFTREGDIYAAVYKAVQDALMAGGLVPTISNKVAARETPEGRTVNYPAGTSASGRAIGGEERLFTVPPRPAGHTQADTQAFHDEWRERTRPALPVANDDPFEAGAMNALIEGMDASRPTHGETILPSTGRSAAPAAPQTGHSLPGTEEPFSSTGADYRPAQSPDVRVLAQTRNQYIVAQAGHALLLIDQHIAHERVLYEQLLKGAEGGGAGIPVQRLALPLTLELSKREALVVEQRLPELARAGWDMEPFGGDAFVVRSVPASLAQKHIKAQDGPEATLRSIVDELVEKSVSRRLLLPAEEVLITASCKMAVKAGDPMGFDEMNALVRDLLASDNPYTCPHGRPIIVELPNTDIDRKFGR